MTQPFIETDLDKFPVIQMGWNFYSGQLENIIATTPFEIGKESMKMHFVVERFGSENIIEPDNTINLVGVNNPKFKARLIL
jgi:hypothetical protein